MDCIADLKFCDSRNDPKIYYRKAEKLYNLSGMRHVFKYCVIVNPSPVFINSQKNPKKQKVLFKCALENFGRDMSYEERLMVLKWPMPQQRRLFSSLTECYKTINSLNRLDPSNFYVCT